MGSTWGGKDKDKSQNVYKKKGPAAGGNHRNDSYDSDPCVIYGLAVLSITIGTVWGAVQGFPT